MSRVLPQAGAPSGVPCSPQVPVRPESRSSHPGVLVSLIAVLVSLGGGFSPWAVPPALLLGALGLFPAQQAQAQADNVLVSNMGQTIALGTGSGSLRAVALDEDSFATGFTTGSAPRGYILSSIDTRMHLIPSNSFFDLAGIKAELWSSNNGAPNAKIVSLTSPTSVVNGPVVAARGTKIVTFTAPNGTLLAPDTTYHLVLYKTNTPKDEVLLTASASEDAGAATGWSIADAYNFILETTPPSGTWSTRPSSDRLAGFVRVRGRAVADISDLSMTTGGAAVDLSPGFHADTTSYTATVPFDATNVVFTPTWSGEATVFARTGSVFLGRPITFRESGSPRTLNLRAGGATRVEVTISSDGDKTYELIILRDSGEPKDLGVTPGVSTLDLSWTAPAGTVTGYDVQYTLADAGTVADDAAVQTGGSASASTGWVAVSRSGTAASQEITGLFEDTEYRVRVRTKYSTSDSDWVFGKGRTLVTLKWPGSTQGIDEGDTARQFRVNAGTIGAALSGTLTYAAGATNPASLSDDLVTGYATTFSSAAGAVPAVTMAASVNDTVNEEHETFTITLNAGTGYVVGSPSTITVTITDNDPPTAPSGLSLTPGSGGISASWTKPVGPVTGYELRYKQTTAADQDATTQGDPSTGWVTSTSSITTTSAEITGLTNDTGYDVQVRATDGQTQTGNGYGAWTASQSGTPMEGLGGLTDLSLATGGEAVALSPDFDTDTTSYTATVPADATSVDVTPAWSGTATVFATGTTINRRRPLSFRRDPDDPNTLVTKTVNLASSGATTVNVIIIPASSDQQTYTVTITREAGAAPTGLGVTPGNTTLALAWTAPAGTLTGYDVQYTSAPTSGDGAVTNDAAVQTGDSATAADGWVAVDRGTEADPPAASQEITDLTNGTTYRVRVRAKTSEGDSDWSSARARRRRRPHLFRRIFWLLKIKPL